MKKWVAALRSGEFKQVHGRLEDKDGNCCCLGILCNIALAEGVCDYSKDCHFSDSNFSGSSDTLPPEVREWAKIKNHAGEFVTKTNERIKLTNLNDTQKKTFSEIADIIETHYKEL